ncbi:MAG: hypothetical protein KAJ95_01155 [Gammaproteobacteria bacterium]|nr:hypothetical protein [Gammaproteobacteria bacterium]
MENYSDEDITFFMGLYRDRERAEGALLRLRTYFPDARVIIRSDGDDDPENYELSERYGAEYYADERLYPVEHGGKMIARIFDLFLQQPTRYFLKIDTDTGIYRRFRCLPGESGAFGTLQKSREGCASIQGGFVGFSEDIPGKVLSSGILNDKRLQDPLSYQADSIYFNPMGRRSKRIGLCSFDWVLGWALAELQIPMVSFDEVYSHWRVPIDNDELKFAITHPKYF